MSAAPNRHRIVEGLVIDDRYELLGKLAAGGMGSVWRARHCQLDVEVAVKFMDATLTGSAEFRGRFEREARAAARLRTRHVARVLDHGHLGDQPYIVLELLRGEDLRSLLTQSRRLGFDETCRIVEQLALGLTAAHELGIVHRDLKPSNVFLAHEDGETVVKLLDFGVAKAIGFGGDEHRTSTGVLVGSPNFMSPEQARSGRDIDARSDLWSLAVIAYRCLTGRHPFPGDHAADVLLRICKGPIAPPTNVRPDLPVAVDAFFARALDRDPAGRFASAAEFAAALRTSLEGGGAFPNRNEELLGSLASYAPQETMELDVPESANDGASPTIDVASGVRATNAAAETTRPHERDPSHAPPRAERPPRLDAAEVAESESGRRPAARRFALPAAVAAVVAVVAVGTLLLRSREGSSPPLATRVGPESTADAASPSASTSAIEPIQAATGTTSAVAVPVEEPTASANPTQSNRANSSAATSPSAISNSAASKTRAGAPPSPRPSVGTTTSPGPSWGF